MAICALALAGLTATLPAAYAGSDAMLQLAQRKGCLACHAVDQHKVGPAWAAVAARFRANPQAPEILQNAILNGEQGTWGVLPMPAYAPDGYITPRQARELARWILTLPPAGTSAATAR